MARRHHSDGVGCVGSTVLGDEGASFCCAVVRDLDAGDERDRCRLTRMRPSVISVAIGAPTGTQSEVRRGDISALSGLDSAISLSLNNSSLT
jgi:hypothetical protein